MTRAFRHSRLSLIAFAAVVGMLSVAGESAACEATKAPKPARSCCAGRPAGDCGGCCRAARNDSAAGPNLGRVLPPSGSSLGLDARRPNCECRPGEPATPASRTEPSKGPNRPMPDRAAGLAFSVETHRIVSTVAAPLCPLGSSKTPVYLRNFRLLF